MALVKIFNMMQERIDERTTPLAIRGMHNHSRGFIYNEQRIIFIHDIERDIFGVRFWPWLARHNDLDLIATFYFIGWTGKRFTVYIDGTRFNSFLHFIARCICDYTRKELVDPLRPFTL